MKPALVFCCLTGAAMVCPPIGRASVTRSLATEFVEVLVEGVPVASRYVLEAKSVEVRNQSDLPMKIRYDADVPQPDELRAGYEPIPDAAWVSFEPRVFDLKPGDTAAGKLVLYVPDDPNLVGRKFQVMLLLHADPGAGSVLSIGLKPRFLFTVAAAKAGAAEKPRVVNTPRPLAWVKPYLVGGGEPRIVFDAEPLNAENHWEDEMTYEVVRDREAVKHIALRPDETVLPDPAWVEVLPQVVVLPPGGKADLAVSVRLPLSAEHLGKTYASVIHTVARRKGQPAVDSYNKVRVSVPPLLTETGTGGGRR